MPNLADIVDPDAEARLRALAGLPALEPTAPAAPAATDAGDPDEWKEELGGIEVKADTVGELEHKADPGLGGAQVLEADDATGRVVALVSVTGVEDRVKDIIEPGAYAETLKNHEPIGVWSHDDKTWVARTESAEELMPGDPFFKGMTTMDGKPWPAEAGAVKVVADFNLDTPHGAAAFSDVKFFKGKTGWSIGYRATKAARHVRTGVRRIKALDWFEYSPVMVGAASQPMTLSVKSLAQPVDPDDATGLADEALLETLSEAELDQLDQFKAALGLEVKDRVRTPSGAAHFGQPIGSVIVPDGKMTGPIGNSELQKMFGEAKDDEERSKIRAAVKLPEGERREFLTGKPDAGGKPAGAASKVDPGDMKPGDMWVERDLDGKDYSMEVLAAPKMTPGDRNVAGTVKVRDTRDGSEHTLALQPGRQVRVISKAEPAKADNDNGGSEGGGESLSDKLGSAVQSFEDDGKGTDRSSELQSLVDDYEKDDSGENRRAIADFLDKHGDGSHEKLAAELRGKPIGEVLGEGVKPGSTPRPAAKRDAPKVPEGTTVTQQGSKWKYEMPGNVRAGGFDSEADARAAAAKRYADHKDEVDAAGAGQAERTAILKRQADEADRRAAGGGGGGGGADLTKMSMADLEALTKSGGPDAGKARSELARRARESAGAKEPFGEHLRRRSKVNEQMRGITPGAGRGVDPEAARKRDERAQRAKDRDRAGDASADARIAERAKLAAVNKRRRAKGQPPLLKLPKEAKGLDVELAEALTEVEVKGSSASLDRSPRSNWVEKAGQLPPYVREVARSIEKTGHDLSSAIAIAIGRMKKWAVGGDGVTAETQAKAAKAVAQWEALKAKNAVKHDSVMLAMLETKAMEDEDRADDAWATLAELGALGEWKSLDFTDLGDDASDLDLADDLAAGLVDDAASAGQPLSLVELGRLDELRAVLDTPTGD